MGIKIDIEKLPTLVLAALSSVLDGLEKDMVDCEEYELHFYRGESLSLSLRDIPKEEMDQFTTAVELVRTALSTRDQLESERARVWADALLKGIYADEG